MVVAVVILKVNVDLTYAVLQCRYCRSASGKTHLPELKASLRWTVNVSLVYCCAGVFMCYALAATVFLHLASSLVYKNSTNFISEINEHGYNFFFNSRRSLSA